MPGPARRGVAVLCYHQVEDLSHDPVLGAFAVPPALLAGQLDALRDAGHAFVSLDDALDALDGRARLPRRAVLVTFDDAYESLREHGLPLLRERGIPGVVFAISGRVGASNDWSAAEGRSELPLMDAAGLAEAAEAGLRIGCHAATHRPLTAVPDAELDAELVRSRDELEALGLGRPRVLAYPYGDNDERVRRAVAAAGYEAAFTVEAGVARAGMDSTALPRIGVRSEDSPERLVRRVRSAA
jgi:peptidoglycan/xylan/chitin deacetylase (PgdA/CDA1 family)